MTDFFIWVGKPTFIIFLGILINCWGPTSCYVYYNCLLTNLQKGIWSYYNIRHDQCTMGIDPINKISIITRILFEFTLFQHSPLTRRVFFSSIMREREENIINNIRWEESIINIILAGVSINHQKISSSATSSFSKECHHHLHQYVLL
jgi:hypothetical protein